MQVACQSTAAKAAVANACVTLCACDDAGDLWAKGGCKDPFPQANWRGIVVIVLSICSVPFSAPSGKCMLHRKHPKPVNMATDHGKVCMATLAKHMSSGVMHVQDDNEFSVLAGRSVAQGMEASSISRVGQMMRGESVHRKLLWHWCWPKRLHVACTNICGIAGQRVTPKPGGWQHVQTGKGQTYTAERFDARDIVCSVSNFWCR